MHLSTQPWIAAFALVSALSVGCSKSSAGPAPAASSTISSAPAPTTPSSGVAPSETIAPEPGEGIFGRLGREAKSRPTGKPNADDVFAALEKVGVSIPNKQQSLGATYKAAYCNGGYTPDDKLAVTVCEYTNDADATAGGAFSKSLFPTMTARDVTAHKTLTLSVVQQPANAENAALAKKATAAFQAL